MLCKRCYFKVDSGEPESSSSWTKTPRYALIKRFSLVLSSSALVAASATADVRLGLYHRIARVPSQANLADGPSRLDFKECEALPGWDRIEIFPFSLGRNWQEL